MFTLNSKNHKNHKKLQKQKTKKLLYHRINVETLCYQKQLLTALGFGVKKNVYLLK